MPDACVVVPCFNEANRLKAADFLAHLDIEPRVSFCFVDDGSTDQTRRTIDDLARLAPQRIVTLSLPRNTGKAEAVRAGVMRAIEMDRFAFIGYWDADLAAPLAEVIPMLDLLTASPRCHLVLGSRWKRLGSDIRRSWLRHVLGRVFATGASLVLDMPVYDSQCGAKVCRAESAGAVFGEPFITRWLFDVEILARLRLSHPDAAIHELMVEMPLGHWHHVGGSRLRLPQMLATPAGLLRIYRRYR